MRKPTGFVIYEGQSLLDGAPIVAIALTGSSNPKTGDMVQTYILRQDVRPAEALRTGQDASICGDCKHRPLLGGACYVVVAQGPTVVWKGYKAGKRKTCATCKACNGTTRPGQASPVIVAHGGKARRYFALRSL